MGLLELLGIGNKKKEMMQEALSNGAVIVDVRTPAEFKQGHVKGSLNYPLNTISGKVSKLKKMGKPVVLCCASGARSGRATSMLQAEGIEAYNGGSWASLR